MLVCWGSWRLYSTLPAVAALCRLLRNRPSPHFAPVKAAARLADSELRIHLDTAASRYLADDVPAALHDLTDVLAADSNLPTPSRLLVARLARVANDAIEAHGVDHLAECLRRGAPATYRRPRHAGQVLSSWAVATGGSPTRLLADALTRMLERTPPRGARPSSDDASPYSPSDPWNARCWRDDEIACYLAAVARTWLACSSAPRLDNALPAAMSLVLVHSDDATAADALGGRLAPLLPRALGLLVAELEARLSTGISAAAATGGSKATLAQRDAASGAADAQRGYDAALDLLDGLFFSDGALVSGGTGGGATAPMRPTPSPSVSAAAVVGMDAAYRMPGGNEAAAGPTGTVGAPLAHTGGPRAPRPPQLVPGFSFAAAATAFASIRSLVGAARLLTSGPRIHRRLDRVGSSAAVEPARPPMSRLGAVGDPSATFDAALRALLPALSERRSAFAARQEGGTEAVPGTESGVASLGFCLGHGARVWRLLAQALADAARSGRLYAASWCDAAPILAAFGSGDDAAAVPSLAAVRALCAAAEGVAFEGAGAASDNWLAAASLDQLAALASLLARGAAPSPRAPLGQGGHLFPHVALARICDAALRLTLPGAQTQRLAAGLPPWDDRTGVAAAPPTAGATWRPVADCVAATAVEVGSKVGAVSSRCASEPLETTLQQRRAANAAVSPLHALLDIASSCARAGVTYAPLALGLEALIAGPPSLNPNPHPNSRFEALSAAQGRSAVTDEAAPVPPLPVPRPPPAAVRAHVQRPHASLLRAADLLLLSQYAARAHAGMYAALVAVADSVVDGGALRGPLRPTLAPPYAALPVGVQTQFPLFLCGAGVHHGPLLRRLALTFTPIVRGWATGVDSSGPQLGHRRSHTRSAERNAQALVQRGNVLSSCLQTLLISGAWAWESDFVAALFSYADVLARDHLQAIAAAAVAPVVGGTAGSQSSRADDIDAGMAAGRLPRYRHVGGAAVYFPWRPLHWLSLQVDAWNASLLSPYGRSGRGTDPNDNAAAADVPFVAADAGAAEAGARTVAESGTSLASSNGCTVTSVGAPLPLPSPPLRRRLPQLGADTRAALRDGRLGGLGASSGNPLPAAPPANVVATISLLWRASAESRPADDGGGVVASSTAAATVRSNDDADAAARRRSLFHDRMVAAASRLAADRGWEAPAPEIYVAPLNMTFDVAWPARRIAVEADGPVHYLPLPAALQLDHAAALLRAADPVGAPAAGPRIDGSPHHRAGQHAGAASLPPSPALSTARAASLLVDPRLVSAWRDNAPLDRPHLAYVAALLERRRVSDGPRRPPRPLQEARCWGLPLSSPQTSRDTYAGGRGAGFPAASSRSNSALTHASLFVHTSRALRPGDGARDGAASRLGWRVARVAMMEVEPGSRSAADDMGLDALLRRAVDGVLQR